MHTQLISLARKFFLGTVAVIGLLLLSGCDMKLTNLTPPSVQENPSQIYTLTLRISPASGAIIKESIMPSVVIGGQNFAMRKSALENDIYEFDYQLPAGTDEMSYYFLVQYKIDANNIPRDREAYTDILRTKVAKRYVLTLEVNRAPVGARIAILGRGFTPQDVVLLDNQPARTVFESPNSLSFFVPPVAANRNYRVALQSVGGASPVGMLRVDPSTVQVFPASLNLTSGQTQAITFTLPYPASMGGLLLDITTDVPESVIMPEVVVPNGQNSVTVQVQGGKKGSGSLYLKGYGQGEVVIPVTVR